MQELAIVLPQQKVVHTFREANQCTDVLARLGARSDPSFVVFLNPLPVVASMLAFKNMICIVIDLSILSFNAFFWFTYIYIYLYLYKLHLYMKLEEFDLGEVQ